jgi:hypothetical protein
MAKTAAKLVGPLTLTGQAWQSMWRGKGRLWAIVSVVAIPVTIISLLTADSDPTLSAYSAFATVFMNIAVLWAVMRLAEGDNKVTLARAYYSGTAIIARFLLVAGLLVLMALPFLIGGAIYYYGIAGTPPASLAVDFLLGLVWLLLAWPSGYWLSRTIFALLEFDGKPELKPTEAVRLSWSAVRGKGTKVFGRLIWLLMVLLLSVTVPAFAVLSTLSGALASDTLVIIQLAATFIIVPLSYFYLLFLYRELKAKPSGTKGA